MNNIHHVSANGANFQYHEPKSKDGLTTKGIMYEKFNAKTNETKIKSGGNFIEQLWMKVRGYSEMKETTAKTFLKNKFPDVELHHETYLSSIKKFSGKKTEVVRTEVFQSNFNAMKSNDALVKNLKSMLNT